mmetsp:Transcript_59815/g.142801  ORF Transcript_59815/g.142801 Transcript_59815/m.142801 type:complete len:112 (+) Transcript_59815:935-1270(+)
MTQTQQISGSCVISLLKVLEKYTSLDMAVKAARCPASLQGRRFEQAMKVRKPGKRRRWMQRYVASRTLEVGMTSRCFFTSCANQWRRNTATAQFPVQHLAPVCHLAELGKR